MRCFVVSLPLNRQFESLLLKEVCNLLQIKKTHTTPYRPQGNGMVERFNRTLLDMLATAVGDHPSDWEIHIRKLCFAYNTSVHSTTGYSQFFPMFGRQATIPVDLMHNLNQGQEKELPSYAHQLQEGLKEAYALVRNHCESEHQLQKAIYDRKVHGKPFSIGNIVWLFSPAVPSGRCKKFHHPWKGPFIVVEKKGSSTYKIKDRNGGKFQIVHFDRLKPCMKTSALNDELPAPPKSNISSSLSQQPQVMARPDTPHGDEDLLLSVTKTEVKTMTHIPLTWVPLQKYLSHWNNTPSLSVFLTRCVAIQPENAAPRIITVHSLNTRKKGEQCNELVKIQ